MDEAFDAAERAGRVLMEAFMWRFHPATEQLTRLVAEGAIGDLRVVARASASTRRARRDVRWSGELEGGALMDVGCYCVSALRLLCGEPERVSGEAVEGGTASTRASPACCASTATCSGCSTAAWTSRRSSASRWSATAGCSRSTDPWHGVSPALVLQRADGGPEPITTVAVDPYCRELEAFARAVGEGSAPPLGRADALSRRARSRRSTARADEGRSVTL